MTQLSPPADAPQTLPADSSAAHPALLEEHAPEPNGLAVVGNRWPHLFVGVLLSMGIFGITADPSDRLNWLIWLPPGLLLGWIALQVVFAPRKPKAKLNAFDDEWDDAESARIAAKTALITDGAPVAEVKAEEPDAAGPAVVEDAGFGDFNGVVVIWGSETGNAQGLADATQARITEAGMEAKSVDAGKVSLASLQTIQRLLIITSTWGDGEPPSNAAPLWEALQKGKADLKNMKFSVCAIGDSGYPAFCQCGKDFDSNLAKNGATRLAPRVDCDVEFEPAYETWINSVIPALQANPVTA